MLHALPNFMTSDHVSCSLLTLQQFVSEFGVEKTETTHSVVKRLIKKHTEPVSRSYHSMLENGRDKYGHRWCGEQSVFVSHRYI